MTLQKHETAPESVTPSEKSTVRRRGLIAGAAALVAGALATRMSSETVDAADGVAILQGAASNANNTAATLTTLTAPTTVAVFRAAQATVATPDTSLDALQGFAQAANNSGVHGRNDTLNGIGTTGVATNGTGVYGQSSSGSAVGGLSTSGSGIYGVSTSGTGVNGSSTSNYGVFGTSVSSFGGWFEAGTAQGSGGVVGVARNAGTVGFQALAVSPAQYAGFFVGTVSITGSLGVSGSKFAVVKGTDGQYRGMYAVESPECWFEDFGTGTLANGVATIKLDPQFAQHIHTDSYHVFLTSRDAHSHLIAKGVNASSFSVEADQALATLKGIKTSDLNGTFSWRVVAKRNDIKGERLPIWDMPQQANVSAKPQKPAVAGVTPLPKQK